MKTVNVMRVKSFASLTTASLLAVLAVACLFPACANLPNFKENETSVDADVAILNKYVWRGLVVSDYLVAQPSITVENSGFGANVWGNLDLDKSSNGMDTKNQFIEIDYTLSYTHQVDCLSLSGGLVHYTFPNTGLPAGTRKEGDTTELFAGVSLSEVILAPTLNAYFDVDEANGGSYWNFCVGHSLDLFSSEGGNFSTLDLGAGLAWGSSEYNRSYFGGASNPGSGLVDFTASASLPIDIGENGDSGWLLTPTVMYANLIDSDLRHNHGEENWSIIWGVSLGIPF